MPSAPITNAVTLCLSRIEVGNQAEGRHGGGGTKAVNLSVPTKGPRRPAECPQKRAPHSLAICESGFMSNDVDGQPALLHHDPGGLDAVSAMSDLPKSFDCRRDAVCILASSLTGLNRRAGVSDWRYCCLQVVKPLKGPAGPQ
jgi:hypothetical protein